MGVHSLRRVRRDGPSYDDRDVPVLEDIEALIAECERALFSCYKGKRIVLTNGLTTLSTKASSLIWLRLVQQNIVMSVSMILSSSRKAMMFSFDFRQNRPPSSLCSAR